VDYQDYAEEAASTGSVTLKGKITETHSFGARTSNYSGYWTLSGTLRLSGFYNDDVVFTAMFSEEYYAWSGTLTTPSDSFQVSH